MTQSWFENNLDTYTQRARLRPALIVVLPLVLVVLTFFPNEFTSLGIVVSVLGCCGGIALLAHFGRDMGKKKEEPLFASWNGGKPTTRMLRHSTAPNPILLVERHSKLQTLLLNQKLPTASEEAASPASADKIYEACTNLLIQKTRDKEKFPLVFEENCNYGFRRNLWGMKPIGVTTSILGVLVVGGVIINFWLLKSPIPLLAIISGSTSLFLLILWIFWFTPSWVKVAADAYAERLLESCESL